MTMTADELLHRADREGRCELVRGHLVTLPFEGAEHGLVAGKVLFAVSGWARAAAAGMALAGGTGFLLHRDPDTVRAPDYAFVPKLRMKGGRVSTGYVEVAPALVVEVLSENDGASALEERIDEWLGFGVDEVWVVNPKARALTVHVRGKDPHTLRSGDVLTGTGALAGFTLAVAELFSR